MIDEESLRNTQSADATWLLILASVVLVFGVGGAFGAVAMKWATDDDNRSLRDQNRDLAHDAKACCDVAYVLNKYRGTPAQCEPKPVEKP